MRSEVDVTTPATEKEEARWQVLLLKYERRYDGTAVVVFMKRDSHSADRSALPPWEPCPMPCEGCSRLDAEAHKPEVTVALEDNLVAKIRSWSQNSTDSKTPV